MSFAESLFDDPVAPGAAAPRPVTPPIPILVFAGLALSASFALLFAGGFADLLHFVGWLLASIVGVGLLAAFTAQDLKRRQDRNYAPQKSADVVRNVLAIAALVLCALHAWTLAWSLAAR
ncbi:MAG: hypothetical protein ACOYOQ_15655 [Microthrixaceae bacterium]